MSQPVSNPPPDTQVVIAPEHRPWQTCPVCFGKGIVPTSFYMSPGLSSVATGTAPETCRSCGGRGMVR